MHTTQQFEPLTLTITGIGECTLLSFELLPDGLRKYESILATAQGFFLSEFVELTRNEIQHIFRALALLLSAQGVKTTESITVLVSGAHDAYPKIDITAANQNMEPCVTAMQFFFWDESCLSNEGTLLGGPVDMQLDEIPVGENLPIDVDDITYCLFLGT